MKVVIFAGGYGTRISEESYLKPKPMVEIGGRPILWHIMKIYQAHGFSEFVICLGYKGYIIKEYFLNYFYHNADFTLDLKTNESTIHSNDGDDFKITFAETGLETKTAGRLDQIKQYIPQGETFMLTYGDGVSDVNIKDLLKFHKEHGKICTVTAYQPSGKFGMMELNREALVSSFLEKPKENRLWVNAGFFVLNYEVFDYLSEHSNEIMWEQEPLKNLSRDSELVAFKHDGFWKCMDILNDKKELDQLWRNNPQWKIWN